MSTTILIGSPNSGKSLLFNRITGLTQKVANYPGITVDVSFGKLVSNKTVTVVDSPGTYSLQPLSAEEKTAVDYFKNALKNDDVKLVLCVFDVTRMEKSLYFTMQVIRECQRYGKPVVALANMYDLVEQYHLQCDLPSLEKALQVTIFPVSAKKETGIDVILEHVQLLLDNPPKEKQVVTAGDPDIFLRGQAHHLARLYGPKGDVLIRSQNRLDNLLLHTFWGGIVFLLTMLILFQSIFTWAAPLMSIFENSIAILGGQILSSVTSPMLSDFLRDAVFGGMGSFLVFVPQVFILTLIIGALEDSGYLARAAIICHRPLSMFGLTGKSFIPLLSGTACAIPAVYAARTIDSPQKRIFTYLAIPLMPCSARLPVYILLITVFIPQQSYFGGMIGLKGIAMFFVYFLGLFSGLLMAGLVAKYSKEKQSDLPFILEMPAYRVPVVSTLLRTAYNRSIHFVTKAGKVIFLVSVGVWILGYFPNYGTDLSTSWLGVIGHVIEPIFTPLGLDWRYGIAILSSFLAREVFVGTLGTLFGIENATEMIIPLAQKIQHSNLEFASGVALVVFFIIALQCIATLAVIAKEQQSWVLPVKMFFGYGILAYALALLSYYSVQLFS